MGGQAMPISRPGQAGIARVKRGRAQIIPSFILPSSEIIS
jgi:hypothetical protein